jgi:hypothetical protein
VSQELTDDRFEGENTPVLTIRGATSDDLATFQFNSYRGPSFEAVLTSPCGTPQFFSSRRIQLRLIPDELPTFYKPFNLTFSGINSRATGTAFGPTEGEVLRSAAVDGNRVTNYSGGGSTGSGFDSLFGTFEADATVASSGSIEGIPNVVGQQLQAWGSWGGSIADRIPVDTIAYASVTMGSLSYTLDFPAWVRDRTTDQVSRVNPGTYSVAGNIGGAVSSSANRTLGGGFSLDLEFLALRPTPTCDPIDFNQNALFPEDEDLIDFLSVLAGGPCSPGNTCNDIDFNNDGLFPADDDLVAFLRVLAGGDC